MPTYIYRREDGSTFELVQRMSEDPLTVDPETGQKVRRVISGAGLIFKGEGFYLTDYARKKEATTTKSDKADEVKSKNGNAATEKPASGEKAATTEKAPAKESTSKKDD